MSAPILPQAAGAAAPRRVRRLARAAVVAAHVMSRLPPALLEQVMGRVVSRGRRPDVSVVQQYRRAVVSVSTACAGEGCLPRSIATALVAGMNGEAVSWRTGVKDAPFTAHAWVEVDGRAVGEAAEVSTFSVVLSATPRYEHQGAAQEVADHD